LDLWPDVGPDRVSDRALLCDRPRAQRRPGDRQPLTKYGTQIDPRRRARLKGDLHEPPFERQAVEVALDVVATYHVEDDVHPAAAGQLTHDRYEVELAIIDRSTSAELLARSTLRVRPGRHNHRRAKRLRQLNGRRADAARSAMDEQPLAWLQASAIEH